MRQILTIGRYFRARHGAKVRKIPISLPGFTCPNIDGSVAKGGCTYCKNESFSPSLKALDSQPKSPVTMNLALKNNPLLEAQLAALRAQFAKHSRYHSEAFGVEKYMIYLQSFSNTYAHFDTLKALYTAALGLPNVVGLSIGTRTDCVEEGVLELLGGFVEEGKDIWLEYGIQSIFNDTLRLINRGHAIEGARELVARTKERGVKVCAHLIFGLPRESDEMMLSSLREVLSWGVDGLKIHPLYVVEGTAMQKMYESGRYTPISLENYAALIVEALKIIPPSVVVQRVSAGAHDESLIAPKWCFDKNIQMNFIREKLRQNGMKY